eukprot:EG_transcript_15202
MWLGLAVPVAVLKHIATAALPQCLWTGVSFQPPPPVIARPFSTTARSLRWPLPTEMSASKRQSGTYVGSYRSRQKWTRATPVDDDSTAALPATAAAARPAATEAAPAAGEAEGRSAAERAEGGGDLQPPADAGQKGKRRRNRSRGKKKSPAEANATSSAAVPGDTAETKAERDPEAAASSNSEGEGAQRKGLRSTHFLGVPLPDVYRIMAEELVGQFEAEVSKSLRLVAPAKMHVTLHFLGELAPGQVAALRTALAAAVTRPRFDMQLRGGGCFPSLRKPRVLWIGCREGDWPDFEQLLAQIVTALEAAGLPAKLDDDFHPHITVGRARQRKGPPLKQTVEQTLAMVAWPVVPVDRITLWRSDHQHHSAPIYTIVEEFPLGPPPPPEEPATPAP